MILNNRLGFLVTTEKKTHSENDILHFAVNIFLFKKSIIKLPKILYLPTLSVLEFVNIFK